MQKSIILVGIKHCGKSTQGELLSRTLSLPFFDTDSVITSLEGRTPREIFSTDGASAFYEAELRAVRHILQLLQSKNEAAVIATGGGICNNEAAVEELKKMGTIVFLCAEEKTACDRIVREITFFQDGTLKGAPAYIAEKNPKSQEDVRQIFHNFYSERTKKYKSLADITVFMQNAAKQVNTNAILEKIRGLS